MKRFVFIVLLLISCNNNYNEEYFKQQAAKRKQRNDSLDKVYREMFEEADRQVEEERKRKEIVSFNGVKK